MSRNLTVYEFSDTAFVVGSDAVVCVVPLAAMRPYMTTAELNEAFSGYTTYRQTPWMARYVGVWGRKNGQRSAAFTRARRGSDHRSRTPAPSAPQHLAHKK